MAGLVTPVRKGPTATTRLELDFGDADLVVREFSDGMWAIEVNGMDRLLVNTDQMRDIVTGFVAIGRAKGWIDEGDGS
jgi:hypothetical protein